MGATFVVSGRFVRIDQNKKMGRTHKNNLKFEEKS
jgi:hypothetical protein